MSTSAPPRELGPTLVRAGVVDQHRTEALAGLLGSSPRDLDVLPAMWHVVQLLDAVPQAQLGDDGHPRSGVPASPGPGFRRMFAGGRSSHLHPLVVGEPATRTSTVVVSVDKVGRSGPLTFTTVRHELAQFGRTAIVDEHDIVYRPADPEAALLASTTGGPGSIEIVGGSATEVDAVLLFRFSALTYNAHRIHYDLDHARVEGFAGLVVHGPLQALLMAEELDRTGTKLFGQVLAYRLVAPAIGAQRLVVRSTDEAAAEVVAGNGSVVARGEVVPLESRGSV